MSDTKRVRKAVDRFSNSVGALDKRRSSKKPKTRSHTPFVSKVQVTGGLHQTSIVSGMYSYMTQRAGKRKSVSLVEASSPPALYDPRDTDQKLDLAGGGIVITSQDSEEITTTVELLVQNDGLLVITKIPAITAQAVLFVCVSRYVFQAHTQRRAHHNELFLGHDSETSHQTLDRSRAGEPRRGSHDIYLSGPLMPCALDCTATKDNPAITERNGQLHRQVGSIATILFSHCIFILASWSLHRRYQTGARRQNTSFLQRRRIVSCPQAAILQRCVEQNLKQSTSSTVVFVHNGVIS